MTDDNALITSSSSTTRRRIVTTGTGQESENFMKLLEVLRRGTRDTAPAGDTPAVSGTFPLVDTFGKPGEVPLALALKDHLEGSLPHSRVFTAGHTLDLDAVIALRDFQVLRSNTSETKEVFSGLLRFDENYLVLEVTDSSTVAYVFATDFEEALSLCRDLRALAPEEPEKDPASVTMVFSSQGPSGPSLERRPVTAPAWEEISHNYTGPSQKVLAELMKVEADEDHGRIILLHGPPGTGKTTAIRSLARSWEPWCQTVYVLDPERLFSDVSYLRSLVLDTRRRADGWRLFVVEDADEIITANAKARTGQALARLLNVSDGILGQGTQALFLITTNEPVDRLHPAVTRPGRCLADIEVGALSAPEANDWLKKRGSLESVSAPTTLAELYALAASSQMLKTTPEVAVSSGQYL